MLKRGGPGDVERGVLRLFGASSLDECSSTYELVGAAERSGLDEAVERLAVSAGETFRGDVEAEFARIGHSEPVLRDERSPSPYDDLVELPEEQRLDQHSASKAESRNQTYRIRRLLINVGRSYWVEDAAGARVFKVAGKLRFRRLFSIRDVHGNVLYSVREKLLVLDPTFVVSRDGIEAAVVKRTTTSGATNDKFKIALPSGEVLNASGKLWTDEGVDIRQGSASIANIRREQNIIREVFHATFRRADQALLLAIAMSIVETDLSRGNGST